LVLRSVPCKDEAGRKKMYFDMSEKNSKSKVREQIDENLRRIYDETLKEDIPDRLTQLLDQLRQKAPGHDGRETS
jgi:hemerythrin-like domain-containing protein